MDSEVKFIARPGFMIREVAGESMLIPINTGNVYIGEEKERLPDFNGMIQLNEMSLFLWNNLQEAKTLNELVKLVQSEYDTENQDIQSDIEEFLDIGIKNQIIFLVRDR